MENTAYFVTTCTAHARPLFGDARCAEMVMESARWFRKGGRIWLLGCVVMPDHVHLAFALRGRQTLSQVMQVLKGSVSRRLRLECGVSGPVWQPGFFDKAVRDRAQAYEVLDYIHGNPVRAGFCATGEQYPFSSAHPRWSKEMDWWWLG